MMRRYQSHYHLEEELSKQRASVKALWRIHTWLIERTAKSVWLEKNE